MKIIKAIWKFLITSNRCPAEQYLSEATDCIDLERRQKEIYRGTAPFQIRDSYWRYH